MITISHTHADGTLVYGTSKGDGVYELIGPRTAARFRYFPSIKQLGIAQSRDHLAKRWQIDMAAKALREAGYEVTVEIDDTPRDVTEVKADRAERLDARADRLTTKAERNLTEAERRHATADHYAERFAGGQPILVGHHSERSARVAQKRIDQNDRAANMHYAKAERASAAAAVVGKADAYRERPAVIIRRIDRLEAELRQTMHQINGTRPANDWRGKYYAPESNPATGDWLEQLEARKTYLEHQLEADRAALAEHEANGYLRLTRETVHKGDLVTYWRSQRAEVVRVNPKTVSVKTEYTWTDKVAYNEIKSVHCPHEGTETVITAPKPAKPAEQPAPVVVPERPAPRPEPLRIDARFEFFPTPAGVAVRMATTADLYTDAAASMTVLEPSAGNGAIAAIVAKQGATVDCIELNRQLADSLRASGVARSVRCADFLEVDPEPVYDRVLMNPPFGGQADIRHVTHALGFLKPGGMLVAIMSAGAEFRTDKTAETFRKLVADRGGRIDRLPDDAFKMSGTSVRTVMAVIPAGVPDDDDEPAGCSCCQERSLAGQAHHQCARCDHLGKFHVTCNMPHGELVAQLNGRLW